MPELNRTPPLGFVARLHALARKGDSASWLFVTVVQGLLTWGFIGLHRWSEGHVWAIHAEALVIASIVVTWCLALRTIRERMVELWRFMALNTDALLKNAKRAGYALDPAVADRYRQNFVERSASRLRLIAGGITLPFYFLPLFAAAACTSLYLQIDGSVELLEGALLLALAAVSVAVYFLWSVRPVPAAVPQEGRGRHGLRTRIRVRDEESPW